MSTMKPRMYVSMGVVAVTAMALGLVLAGGLGITPESKAERPIAESAATAAVTGASTSTGAPVGYPDFASLADKVVPTVLSVYTEVKSEPQAQRRPRGEMDPFEFFFGPNMSPDDGRNRRMPGAGSGFFISADGLALTNNHVVDGADGIKVNWGDKTQVKAKVVGCDAATDVALIRVEGSGPFPYLTLGDSDALRVGEWVMAAGNPLRLEHTITVGVVSAKGRSLNISEDASFDNYIQTDAAINLGNSGGPLVNLRGEVIGINTAINAAGQNLGFAVPINTAGAILPQLKEKGKVTRGYLGVNIQNIDEKTQQAFDLPSRQGAFVQNVNKDTPADKAGVKAGDAIVAVNGKPVKDTQELIGRVSLMPPGQKVDLGVIREGKRISLSLTLMERPAIGAVDEPDTAKETGTLGKLGFKVDELTSRVRRAFEIPQDIEGVIVTEVSELSVAAEANLLDGDVIMQINGKAVTTNSELEDAISTLKPGAFARAYVYSSRLPRTPKRFVIMKMPS